MKNLNFFILKKNKVLQKNVIKKGMPYFSTYTTVSFYDRILTSVEQFAYMLQFIRNNTDFSDYDKKYLN